MTQSAYSSALNDTTQTYCHRDPCTDTFYYFEAIQLNISTTANYIIFSNSTMNTYGYIYKDGFIPVQRNIYLIQSDDDSGNNQQFMFNIILQANANYILVVTTFSSHVTGAFSIIATGPQPVAFSRIYISRKRSLNLKIFSKRIQQRMSRR